MRPGDASRRVGAGALIVKFGITGRLIAIRLVPIRPTIGKDMMVEPAMQIDHTGIRTPGTPQRDPIERRIAGERTAIEDKSIDMRLRRRSRRYMRVLLAMDSTFFKPGGSGAKDKIRGPFDVTIAIVLAAGLAIEKKDILIAYDAAMLDRKSVV